MLNLAETSQATSIVNKYNGIKSNVIEVFSMKVYLIRHSEPTYQQAIDAGLQGFGRELGSL